MRIVVDDNGNGLPTEGRERLTEPYMTTAQQGHRAWASPSSRRSWKTMAAISRWRTARVAARASVWYSGATRRKSRRLDRMRQPHNDPQMTVADSLKSHGATIF